MWISTDAALSCSCVSCHQLQGAEPTTSLCFPLELQRVMRLPLSLLFSRLDKPSVLSFSLDIPSNPLTSFVVLLWSLSCILTSLCEAQNPTYSKWGCTNAKQSSKAPLFWQAGCAVFNAFPNMVCPLGCQGTLLAHAELRSPAPPCLFLLICSPATCLLVCTCIWCYSIPGAEPSIFFCWTSCCH